MRDLRRILRSRIRPANIIVVAGVLVWSCSFGVSASAQVNVEKLRKGMNGNGVAGSLDGSLAGRTGNAEGMVAGASSQLHWLHSHHSGLVVGTGDYTRINRITAISRSMVHARYGYHLFDPWWWEVFAQQQTDRFRLLKSRELLGTGPRWGIVQRQDFDLFVGTAYMLEFETIQVPEGAPDAASSTAHRWSSYVSASFLQDSRLTANTTTYIQPRFDRPSDVRLFNETTLVIEISGVLATKISVSVRSDSDPPSKVVPTDVEMKNSLMVKF